MQIDLLEPRRLFSSYYVSPTGSDSNDGLSSAAPWQTVAKVNAETFQPGDQILFKRGGQWRESLVAPSSGTAAKPITFGAFGDSALARPLFIGSDVVSNAAFSLVEGTTSTYSTPMSAVNWAFDNHRFLRLSSRAIASGDPTANLNYVKSNPGSFYFSGTMLYINVGGALSGHVITVGQRDDAVLAFQKSNLRFNELATTETAKLDAGYGFRAQFGSNIQITNCTATLAGKHHFGAIGVTAFVGKDLTAAEAPPDLGYGGASAYVSFSDATRSNDTYQWINLTWQDANGPYPIFITHGDPDSISSVLLENLNTSGWGTGIVCYSTGTQEKVTIRGGHLDDATVELDTDNSLIDGLLVTGATGSVALNGNNDVLSNSVFDGVQPNPLAGRNGAVTVAGQNDWITSNIFRFEGSGPAVNILNGQTNTTIRANAFDCPDPIYQMFNGSSTVTSDRNVVRSGIRVESGDINSPAFYTWAQWQDAAHDQHSLAVPAGSFVYGSTAYSSAALVLAIVPNDDGSGHRLFGSGTSGGLFHGQNPALSAILVTRALPGDTNLDGSVDVSDLGNLTTNYGRADGNSSWLVGDFDSSGTVNVSDLGSLANNYGSSESALAASMSAMSAMSATSADESVGNAQYQMLSTFETFDWHEKQLDALELT